MKNIIFLLILLGTIGCQLNNEQEKPRSKVTQTSSFKPDEIQGIWGLTNYLDSIVINKEIAKYRVQFPSWFGILLDIKNDSINSYGSLVEITDKLTSKKDTVTELISYESGKWMLLKNQKNLVLKHFPNQEVKDSTIYVYRRREDLKFMTQDLDKRHKISSNITKYFNQEILAGTYLSMNTNSTIEFQKEGIVNGFNQFSSFEIRNYFGTLHPHKNLDVVSFKNKFDNEIKQYNWKFNEGVLTLTEFVVETIVEDDKILMTDYYIPGEEKIFLKRLQ